MATVGQSHPGEVTVLDDDGVDGYPGHDPDPVFLVYVK
jgi:hypothetical protein